MARHLRRHARRCVLRLMRKDGYHNDLPEAAAQHAEFARRKKHVYPTFVAELTIDQPNQAWCADVATYIPTRRSFLYLVAAIDWASRKASAWRLSDAVDADFCIAALEEAIGRHGRPSIFNTARAASSQSFAFTDVLHAAGVQISKSTAKGRRMDNVFIERLWRSLKYECVYLQAFETGSEARTGIGRSIAYYNGERPPPCAQRTGSATSRAAVEEAFARPPLATTGYAEYTHSAKLHVRCPLLWGARFFSGRQNVGA